MDPKSYLGNVAEGWRKEFVAFLSTGGFTLNFRDYVASDPMCRLAMRSYCENLATASRHGQVLWAALPQHEAAGHKSKRSRGPITQPQLNLEKLGSALKAFYLLEPDAKPQSGKHRDTCGNCSNPVWLDRNGGQCNQCGQHLDRSGNIIRIGRSK